MEKFPLSLAVILVAITGFLNSYNIVNQGNRIQELEKTHKESRECPCPVEDGACCGSCNCNKGPFDV